MLPTVLFGYLGQLMFIPRFCVYSLFLFFMASTAASAQSSRNPGDAAELLIIGVGGNSECAHRGGVWKLRNDGTLANSIAEAMQVKPNKISTYYFSWTGDKEESSGCLPGHLDWVTGGSARIIGNLGHALTSGTNKTIAIVGWSNGGATAYELACALSKTDPKRVSLLITLDPAAWTTKPCRSSADAPVRPAELWMGVYTKSRGFWDSLAFSNIIGLAGWAWDDKFPLARAERADVLMKLEPANHGDSECMWRKCVLNHARFKSWGGSSTPNQFALGTTKERKLCHQEALCSSPQ